MSVLIKGMRMPQSCRQCRMMTIYYNRPHCAAKDGMILTTPIEYDNILTYPYRHENCPLVEVSGCEYWDSESRFCSLYRPTAEPRYCDRNICASNEVNGIGCEECEIAKYHNLEDDDSPCLDCGEGE